MKTRQCILFLHPIFLFSIVLLLLNDFYLKYAFHNWLTGKLSDFTGLFIFPVFFSIFFTRHKIHIYIITALLFIWWKSSFSSAFILLLNEKLSLPVERAVDYTDFIALIVLPFAYRLKEPVFADSLMKSLAVKTVAIISFFSFCATSLPKHLMYHYYEENVVSYYKAFSSAYTDKEILEKLDPEKRGYRKDSVKYYRIREDDNFYQRIKSQNDSTVIWSPLINSDDSALFVKTHSPVYFTIPSYILLGDTLSNLEFRFYHNARKKKFTTIEIISFQTNMPSDYRDFYSGKKRKQYTSYFKNLFSK